MLPERIRQLIDADPFVPFRLDLVDGHTIYIDDPATAWLEDDGRTLLVRTLVRNDAYVEALDTAAITRTIVKVPPLPAPEAAAIADPPARTVIPRKTRVLFICTRNGARSQMAEAWMNHLGGESIEAESAGFEPGEIHPLAIEAMREVGIDISQQKTKSIFDRYRCGAMFSVTICVCDESAEKPPVFPGQVKRLHWSVPDPLAGCEASSTELLQRMRSARDMLRERIEGWLRQSSAQ